MNQPMQRYRRDWMMIFFIYVAVIASAVSFHCVFEQYIQQQITLKTVSEVCDYSRRIDNGPAEEACGIAQDTSKTAFTCDSTAMTADCRAEFK
jgi:hypothetical protein